MDLETIEKYKKAGKIAAEALVYGKGLIVKGAKVLDVCDKVEEKIISLGGEIAFPAQVSMNSIAAHYCPEGDDESVFSDELVCLDVGAHVDGFVGDNACTVDLSGSNTELVKASSEALKAAIENQRWDV